MLLDDCNQISSDKVFQQNELEVWKVYLNAISTGNWNFPSSDKQKIEFIAAQCPLFGGKGVFLARALQGLYSQSVDYSETDETCQNNPAEKPIAASRDKLLGVEVGKISPNPSNGRFFIYLDREADAPARFSLTDMAGQIVFSTEFQPGASVHPVVVPTTLQGMYFAQIFTNGGILQLGKIVLNK